MIERIEAWLKVRDAQRFQRDMNQSARSVRNLRKEADQMKKVSLGNPLGNLRVSLASFAALSLGATPLVLGLAGATGALTSSLAGAAAGSGALALGIGGTLLPALLGMGILVGRAVADFKDIKTALDAYQLSVAAFGRNSTQAETALRRLSGVVDQHGGVRMLRAVRNWELLGDRLDRLSRPGSNALAGTAMNAIDGVNRILPTFTRNSNKAMRAFERDSAVAFRVFTGGEVQAGLDDFGAAFDKISGPTTRGFTDMLIGLFRIARAAIPHVIDLSRGIERFGQGVNRATDDPVKLGRSIDGLMEHTKAWWALFRETGLLIFHVLRAGNKEGESFVLTLGAGVRHLRELAESAQGQKNIAKFMGDSVDETIAFAQALWVVLQPLLELARDAMPLWTDILQANAVGLTNVLKLILWLSHILEPLGGLLGIAITGFWGWKAAVVAWNIVAAIATFLTGGWTTAFWSLNAAMAANPVGLVILAVAVLAAGLYYAYTRSEWFRNAITNTFNWIKDNWPLLLAILTGPFGLAAYFIVKHFDTIKSAIGSTMDWIGDKINWVLDKWSKVNDKLGGVPGKVLGFTVSHLPVPGLASGGTVTGVGSWWSGEAGPELNTFDGQRIHVSPVRSAPVSGRGTVKPIDPATFTGGATSRTIIVPVQIEGREIARVVAEDTDDRLARGPGED